LGDSRGAHPLGEKKKKIAFRAGKGPGNPPAGRVHTEGGQGVGEKNSFRNGKRKEGKAEKVKKKQRERQNRSQNTRERGGTMSRIGERGALKKCAC